MGVLLNGRFSLQIDGTEAVSAEEADGFGGKIRRQERGSNWDSCAARGTSSQITHLAPSPSNPLPTASKNCLKELK